MWLKFKMNVYHGSIDIIKQPVFGKGKSYNDFGKGFYCTPEIELAKEWACSDNSDGYANCYELDMADLKVLNLNEKLTAFFNHWYQELNGTLSIGSRSGDSYKTAILFSIGSYSRIWIIKNFIA